MNRQFDAGQCIPRIEEATILSKNASRTEISAILIYILHTLLQMLSRLVSEMSVPRSARADSEGVDSMQA